MYMPNYHDYRYYTLFDIACLTEQPSNTVRLHSLSRSYKLQALSRGITYEKSYGNVRVDTVRVGLGNRLRAVVTGLWRFDPHDPLHLCPCIRPSLSGQT